MVFGGQLRPSAIDYIRPHDMEVLRRDLENMLTEIFSRDSDLRLGGYRSLGSSGLGGLDQREALDLVRRTNLVASLVNSRIKPSMHYAEIQPKFTEYGDFPREFERGRRVEEFLTMDITSIDRILQSYNLPRDHRPDHLLSNNLLNSRNNLGGGNLLSGSRDGGRFEDRLGLNRQHKLLILFEYLGVDISHERIGRLGGDLSGSGSLIGSGSLFGGGGSLLSGGGGVNLAGGGRLLPGGTHLR